MRKIFYIIFILALSLGGFSYGHKDFNAFLIDKLGLIFSINESVASKRSSPVVRITGGDEQYMADVQLINGKYSMRTFGIQAIESLRGFDPQADVFFYIGTENDTTGAGNIGDTIRIQIAAGDDPILYPAIDITYTLVASDVGSEEQLSLNIANFLNTNPSFSSLWRAQRISGNGVVYITARRLGAEYERENVGDFQVSATGATTVTAAYDNVIRRNKITGLARDPADPRQGQLGIQGSVTQSEGSVTNRLQVVFPNLAVDGSVVPVCFKVEADPTEVRFISSLVFSVRGNGIKYGQFFSKSGGPLTNGVQVSFKSEDITLVRFPLKTTDDVEDFHSGDPDNFNLSIQSGGDKAISVLQFSVPLELRPQGEYATSDYIQVCVRDDLTSGLQQFRAIFNGFNREF